MRCSIFLLALVCGSARADDWSPPANPNPQAILQEARADAQAKRSETALAKHVWFHENALSIQPSLIAVRLSFGLSYWHELAKEYPPALTKLKEIRDEAKKNVMEGKDLRESFHDMESINDQLGEHAATMKVFETLDEENPEAAKEVFELAKRSLVQSKAYSLFGKYVVPQDSAMIVEAYRIGQKHVADNSRFDARILDLFNKRFANDVTTLVAILAVNDRNQEAEEIAASARAAWDDSSFHAGLKKALKGVVPEPWPKRAF